MFFRCFAVLVILGGAACLILAVVELFSGDWIKEWLSPGSMLGTGSSGTTIVNGEVLSSGYGTNGIFAPPFLYMIAGAFEGLAGYLGFRNAANPKKAPNILMLNILAVAFWVASVFIMLLGLKGAKLNVAILAAGFGLSALYLIPVFVQKSHAPPGSDRLEDGKLW
jgi:amino acid permease